MFCLMVWNWAGIQKPVVTYDPGKFRVTSCDRLRNYLKSNLIYIFLTSKNYFLIVFAPIYCILTSKMTSAMFNKTVNFG
jgi:hypothetical protein